MIWSEVNDTGIVLSYYWPSHGTSEGWSSASSWPWKEKPLINWATSSQSLKVPKKLFELKIARHPNVRILWNDNRPKYIALNQLFERQLRNQKNFWNILKRRNNNRLYNVVKKNTKTNQKSDHIRLRAINTWILYVSERMFLKVHFH